MVTKLALETPRLENGSRRERRRDELRERIFQAAIKLFIKQGFFNTTVEQITEVADVGKGTFFNYFESKEHLVLKLTEAQEAVLRKVVALPIATWNYKSQDAAIRHMGPMAQDFHAAFGLGEFLMTEVGEGTTKVPSVG